MPPMSKHDIENALHQDVEEALHDDVLDDESQLWDQDLQGAADANRYEALKTQGFSEDEIQIHMFSFSSEAHKNCQICFEDKEHFETMNWQHEPSEYVRSLALADDPVLEREALQSAGFSNSEIDGTINGEMPGWQKDALEQDRIEYILELEGHYPPEENR